MSLTASVFFWLACVCVASATDGCTYEPDGSVLCPSFVTRSPEGLSVSTETLTIGSDTEDLSVLEIAASRTGVVSTYFGPTATERFAQQYSSLHETYFMGWSSTSKPRVVMNKKTGTFAVIGKLVAPDSYVPPTMTDACETGTVTWGESEGEYYEYRCVAPNTWRRSAPYTTF